MFDDNSVCLIESWPSLKALHKIGASGWQEFRPIFPLLSPTGVEPEFDPDFLPQESFHMAYQRRAAFRSRTNFRDVRFDTKKLCTIFV